MKKLISIILAILMCVSLGATLVACVEELPPEATEDTGTTEAPTEEATIGPEGISKEEWQQAIANDNFTNVTIEYVVEGENGDKQINIVKITPDEVYRKITSIMGNEEYTLEYLFTGEEAEIQANMFIDVFLSLLAERENFVYDMENGVYNAPEEVSTDVDGGEGMTATETMKNGQVKFSKNGSLEVFTCELTETVYFDGELMHSNTYDTTWNFKDYGKTVITEEEKASATHRSEDSEDENEHEDEHE